MSPAQAAERLDGTRTVAYTVRVEVAYRYPNVTASWNETFKHVEFRIDSGTDSISAHFDTRQGPNEVLPKVLPGTFVGSIDFSGGHGYGPGRCAWTSTDRVPAALYVDAYQDTGGYNDHFIAIAWPVFKSAPQAQVRCGRWILGATSLRKKVLGTPQEPATVHISTGAYLPPGSDSPRGPWAAFLQIDHLSHHSLRPLHFPLSRIYAGKSFASTYSWQIEGGAPGTLRITFTPAR